MMNRSTLSMPPPLAPPAILSSKAPPPKRASNWGQLYARPSQANDATSAPELLRIQTKDTRSAPTFRSTGERRELRYRQDGLHVRVLVVDDDPGIRESLRSLLEDEGYKVSVAADGEEGLRFVLANMEPLAVLLDLLLPNLTGEGMLTAALEHLDGKARAPVSFIIITANPQLLTPHLRTLMRRYNIPVENKPFETDSLLASVAHAHDVIAS